VVLFYCDQQSGVNVRVDLWTLEIIQDTNPDLETDFQITVTGTGVDESATLDDDADPTHSNTFVVDVPQVEITITHTGQLGSVTTVACVGATPSSETTSGDDTIVVLAAQTAGTQVECTFTSTCKTLTLFRLCDSFAQS
jgi:hypothetical protein